jgi:hypothetical protein
VGELRIRFEPTLDAWVLATEDQVLVPKQTNSAHSFHSWMLWQHGPYFRFVLAVTFLAASLLGILFAILVGTGSISTIKLQEQLYPPASPDSSGGGSDFDTGGSSDSSFFVRS